MVPAVVQYWDELTLDNGGIYWLVRHFFAVLLVVIPFGFYEVYILMVHYRYLKNRDTIIIRASYTPNNYL